MNTDREQRFAAYLVHELRTPIALQLALAEAALSDPDADAAAYRTMAKDVAASCERQQRLIDALLQLTLGGRGSRRREHVDLAATMRRALRAHDLGEFRTVVTLKPARTTGDPVLIERLTANLISNAARHNVTGGQIEVETRIDNHDAVLCVANTGQLIPATELSCMFEPFHRFVSDPEARDDGLGLGLAIVRAIADAHEATISPHARAAGGLKLVVRFPIRPECDPLGRLFVGRDGSKRKVGLAGDRVRPTEIEPDP
jgi:signal transduction histidine kinase